MKNKLYFLTYLFITLSIISSHAQEAKLLTVNNELSSSMINHILQDKEGVIWISTENGLNRYDGAKFTTFFNQEKEQSLISNYVQCTFEDSKKRFFICTLDGIQIYDRSKDTFQTLPLIFQSGVQMSANISSIIERYNGDILIGTYGHGIFKLNEDTEELIFKQDMSLSNSFHIQDLHEDRDKNLWIATSDLGIYQITSSGAQKRFFEQGNNDFSCINEDTFGNIYAGCLQKGLYKFNKKENLFQLIPYPSPLHIKCIYATTQEELFIGTDGNGIKIYNLYENKIKEYIPNINVLDFNKTKIHSITKDKHGNIWFGCFQKGVMIVPAIANGFKYIGPKSATSNSIGACCVMSICRDHNGILWVGTDNDGLYSTLSNGELKKHYPPHQGNNPIPSTIMSIYEDSRQQLWIGSYREGLFKLDPKTGKSEAVNLAPSMKNKQSNIYSIVEDKFNNLWIGSLGDGLYKINLQTNKIEAMPAFPNGLEYKPDGNLLPNYWINCLLYTSKNKLYIGTYDGLACLDIPTQNFVTTHNRNRLLPGEVIYALYEDMNGNIWVGTNKGLQHLNIQTEEFTLYTTHDGLPNNTIAGIKGDSDGYLWISTSFGISRMLLADKSFVNFYASDGLQGNEFSKGAVFQEQKGNIIFGGTEGVTYFNPKEIIISRNKPEIYISDFYVHDRPVREGMKSDNHEIITTSVYKANEYHLSYKENSFSIELSTMEFYNPERISYSYNFNNNGWIELQTGTNRVSFSNIQPGKYKFQVRAKDYTNLSEIKEITIIISPPWYDTQWAKVLYVLIVSIIILIVILQIRRQYLIQQKIMKHQHDEEINEAKLQFFINISHEIRTPMSLIISPLQKLISTDKDENRQQSYGTIYRNAERILNLINQLMDIRKIEKGQMILKYREKNIVSLIKEAYNSFDFQAKSKDISIELTTESEDISIWIDTKHFDKIIFNLLSNAIKYTPRGGHIQLILKSGYNPNAATKALQNYMELRIIDNGIGLAEDDIYRIFDRFYQTRNNQNDVNSGTGIGLHLTRSLVELHHGEITAKNNESGIGSCFIVRIPLGNDHLRSEDIDHSTELQVEKIKTELTDREQVSVIPTAPLRAKTKYRILIVEDDEEIRNYLYQELGNDYHIQECNNGKDALATILKKAPDLVITDVMMPEMNGITLCKKIKQNMNINHIPVILLTARTREEDTVEGLQHGADAYITKPFNIEILRQTTINLIKGRELLKNNFSGSQIQEEKIKKINIESPDERLLKRVMKVINENMDNANLNVEMIAKEVGISRVHLHRKLKELTNQSTRDFIRNVRLKQAASLLANKKHSVAEVATLTGFQNVAYFSTAFKDLFGFSPSAYMSQHLEVPKDEEKDFSDNNYV